MTAGKKAKKKGSMKAGLMADLLAFCWDLRMVLMKVETRAARKVDELVGVRVGSLEHYSVAQKGVPKVYLKV